MSDTSHPNWREACALARQEKDPARIPEMCARARLVVQHRQIELGRSSRKHEEEGMELEAALRELWEMEQKKE